MLNCKLVADSDSGRKQDRKLIESLIGEAKTGNSRSNSVTGEYKTTMKIGVDIDNKSKT